MRNASIPFPDIDMEGEEGCLDGNRSDHDANDASIEAAESVDVLRGAGKTKWGGDVLTRPRPDGVTFHIVLKALLSASRWIEAVEVLEELFEER